MSSSSKAISDSFVAVLVACHNRRELTLRALAAAYRAGTAARSKIDVFLLDDGSTDGTSDAIGHEFPDCKIIRADGSRYWNGGMRIAWQAASASGADFFWWLNDDLEVHADVLAEMLSAFYENRERYNSKVIVVGRTIEGHGGTQSYGALARAKGFSQLRFVHAAPNGSDAVTMNGNCVLVPRQVAEELGNFSRHFTHSFGDIDYGLRATKRGYKLIQLEEPVGFQKYNTQFRDNTASLSLSNWRFVMFHPKGVPLKEWLHFCMLHGGWQWPVNFFGRYLKMLWRYLNTLLVLHGK